MWVTWVLQGRVNDLQSIATNTKNYSYPFYHKGTGISNVVDKIREQLKTGKKQLFLFYFFSIHLIFEPRSGIKRKRNRASFYGSQRRHQAGVYTVRHAAGLVMSAYFSSAGRVGRRVGGWVGIRWGRLFGRSLGR